MNISESQQVSQQTFPKIECPNHPKQMVTFINFDHSSQYPLICNSCILNSKYVKLNSEKLVQIESFFNDEEDEYNQQFITNLTPIIPSSEEKNLIMNNEVVQMKQTTEWFNEFKMRINNIIDQNLKLALDNIQQLNQQRNNVINTYNDLSKKTQIKSLIQKYSDNFIELEKSFKILIQEKNDSSQKDKKKMSYLLVQFNIEKQKLDLNQIQKKFNFVESMLYEKILPFASDQFDKYLKTLKSEIKQFKQIGSFNEIINSKNLDKEISLDLKVNSLFNNINNQACKQLSDKLGECINLKYLKIYLSSEGGFTNITSDGCNYLAEGIKKCQQLQCLELNISNNNIKDEGVIELCKGISQHPQLRELNLDLSKNNVGDIGIKAVADLIKQSKNIIHLNLTLYWNYITDNGILSLIHVFKQSRLLYLTLDIVNNKIKNIDDHRKQIYDINSIIYKDLSFYR